MILYIVKAVIFILSKVIQEAQREQIREYIIVSAMEYYSLCSFS